ncbi:MAG TPA: hypothetical protein VJI73_01745 [Candidatus Paceibacterota bacterium]
MTNSFNGRDFEDQKNFLISYISNMPDNESIAARPYVEEYNKIVGNFSLLTSENLENYKISNSVLTNSIYISRYAGWKNGHPVGGRETIGSGERIAPKAHILQKAEALLMWAEKFTPPPYQVDQNNGE